MLIPKKVKYRKLQRGGRIRGKATRGLTLSFGEFGIKTLDYGMINAREIEAARRAMTRYVQKGGKIWIRIFPDHSMTKKGAEVPMGKGKGTPEFFVAKVQPGRILFEMDGVDPKIAKKAMRLASDKLSVRTKFVSKVS
ncbi:MAG: 50S ribosomal protein L16 [Candidatus Moranbacteria bacterium]|jgi:large subunit ribosomal protein L16|nr:50S ribosomal protein L16 [Candidatus Moranbacteria bacterium]